MLRGVNLRASPVILPSLAAVLGAVSLVGVLLAAPAPARACSCMMPTFEDARAGAAAIFEARVEAVEPAGDERRVRLRVTQAWRGVETETVEIVTASSSAACGYEFEVGQHYLVYAGQRETTLAVSLCSRTARVDDASEDRQLLGSGTIPVEVEDESEEPSRREPPAARAGCATCVAARQDAPGAPLAALGVLALAALGTRRSRR